MRIYDREQANATDYITEDAALLAYPPFEPSEMALAFVKANDPYTPQKKTLSMLPGLATPSVGGFLHPTRRADSDDVVRWQGRAGNGDAGKGHQIATRAATRTGEGGEKTTRRRHGL